MVSKHSLSSSKHLTSLLGLSLKYHKAGSQNKAEDKQEADELVLTNMAFYTGLHLWEIIAPISCNSICK